MSDTKEPRINLGDLATEVRLELGFDEVICIGVNVQGAETISYQRIVLATVDVLKRAGFVDTIVKAADEKSEPPKGYEVEWSEQGQIWTAWITDGPTVGVADTKAEVVAACWTDLTSKSLPADEKSEVTK